MFLDITNKITRKVNESILRARECTVQLYKNNVRALLSHILCILNSDWLRLAHSVRRVYDLDISVGFNIMFTRVVTKSLGKMCYKKGLG